MPIKYDRAALLSLRDAAGPQAAPPGLGNAPKEVLSDRVVRPSVKKKSRPEHNLPATQMWRKSQPRVPAAAAAAAGSGGTTDFLGPEERAKLEEIQRLVRQQKPMMKITFPPQEAAAASAADGGAAGAAASAEKGAAASAGAPAEAQRDGAAAAAQADGDADAAAADEAPPAATAKRDAEKKGAADPAEETEAEAAAAAAAEELKLNPNATPFKSKFAALGDDGSSDDEEEKDDDEDPPWGSDIELPPPPAGKQKKVEQDMWRLKQRQKQIRIGLQTVGYKNYLRAKEINFIVDYELPKQPNVYQVCSKRAWDGQIRRWRQLLHKYDDLTDVLWNEDDAREVHAISDRHKKFRDKVRRKQLKEELKQLQEEPQSMLASPYPYMHGMPIPPYLPAELMFAHQTAMAWAHAAPHYPMPGADAGGGAASPQGDSGDDAQAQDESCERGGASESCDNNEAPSGQEDDAAECPAE